MSVVNTLANNAGARLSPKAGSLQVSIFKTAADNTVWGLLVLPHKYQLEVVQCDKSYAHTSMVVDTPDDVKFLLVMLRERAEQKNLTFDTHDHTSEFARIAA